MEYCSKMETNRITIWDACCRTNRVEKYERNIKEIWEKYVRNPHCNGLHNKYSWEIWGALGVCSRFAVKAKQYMGAKTKCGHLQNIPLKRSSPRTLEMLIKSIIWILKFWIWTTFSEGDGYQQFKIWPQTKSSKFSHKVATQVLLSYSLSDSLRC